MFNFSTYSSSNRLSMYLVFEGLILVAQTNLKIYSRLFFSTAIDTRAIKNFNHFFSLLWLTHDFNCFFFFYMNPGKNISIMLFFIGTLNLYMCRVNTAGCSSLMFNGLFNLKGDVWFLKGCMYGTFLKQLSKSLSSCGPFKIKAT